MVNSEQKWARGLDAKDQLPKNNDPKELNNDGTFN
jgi:hypothetical protein